MFRTVALTVVLFGLCPSSTVRADEAEDKAVAFVEKLGGRATRDEKAPGKPVITVTCKTRR
jgi:hypothetical protein